MRITILYDNEILNKDIGLKSDWGFSCVIETKDVSILFDSGANGTILLRNMEILGIDPRDIDKVVISHEHWDHSGGLNALVPVTGNTELYRLSGVSPSGTMQLISVKTPLKIAEDVYTTGKLRGGVDEQSLVLRGKNGWYVLVGCSHPGVDVILDEAKHYGHIVGLIGGYHGFDDFILLKDLDLICPCHCTKYKQELREMYKISYVEGGV
jgi:7,8-dihydropterin-6-yl-methyl-4-(beta-D-ribofuranosyl)aminobenzene 5'-phosphate synthase